MPEQPREPDPRRAWIRTLGRGTGIVAAYAVAVGLLLIAMPAALGTSGRPPVAQLVSFRAPLALGTVVLAGLALAISRGRRMRTEIGVGVVLVVAAAVQTGVLVERGYTGAGPGETSGGPDAQRVVVVSFNTSGIVTAPDLANLALAQDADVVVLPETEQRTGDAAAALLAAAGHPMSVVAHRNGASSATSTVLLVGADLGPYTLTELAPSRQATFVAAPSPAHPADARAPAIIAAHPFAPISRSSMPAWLHDTSWVRDACRRTPGAITAGDLNATLDHPALRDLSPCVDAAASVGAAALGTWPAAAPTWLAAPLDHVIVDARVWDVTGFAVLPALGGSDHRPVVAHLRRR